MYPPQPAAPPPKKSSNGCLIAALIVGGVLLVGALGVGIGIYAFVQSDIGQTTIKVVGATKRLMDKGATAPGAAQVRARGCDQAMVLDAHDFDELMDALSDGGTDAGMPDGTMVICTVRVGMSPPSCDDLAATYVAAVGGEASSEFVVSVQQQGNNTPICRESYDAGGSRVPAGHR